ncbi:hypothetical protein AA19596_2484 [Acetobacter fabarum DSM 19596]|nr:hypothetical protein AA19596_2484 [Acetobacter fabarum DSM 19596]
MPGGPVTPLEQSSKNPIFSAVDNNFNLHEWCLELAITLSI